MNSMRIFAMGAVVMAMALGAWADTPKECGGMPLVFEDSFEDGADRWEMTDAKAWKVEEVDDGHALSLKRPSRYAPPVRSPKSIAWVKGLDVGSFVLDVKAHQTGREYGHRDLCFFFGKQDPAHYYYVHLATKADDHANSIFLVNGEPRVSIAKERTDGTDWGKGFHQIRIKRDTESGRIEVYFDDMDKPVMIAEDKTFTSGTVGLGSFDDVGQFDDVRVWSEKADAQEAKDQ